MMNKIKSTFKQACSYRYLYNIHSWLYISTPQQHLYHFNNDKLINTYPISTSKKPSSCIENSYGTPWGLHKIQEKIGHNQPKGMTFLNRQSTGKLYSEWQPNEYPQDRNNKITSRILRLQGLEKNINHGLYCDTYKRYVYIHGTDKEENIAKQRSSLGCILMNNDDIIQLFNQITHETLVYIEKD